MWGAQAPLSESLLSSVANQWSEIGKAVVLIRRYLRTDPWTVLDYL